ncbi:putative short chain type dehydrogenase [Eremomyces bilateralis CBS 781.70]|uniref:Short chain type dehydrogenase n=1 Tax=Eremomyces bilateralis CBS 781.70 TaxID=1392243 RepID=A0A6G1FQ54_9PEZI|nr:putative short chain type dehydrogenase [Eremomyces bilateralis CBS 781.70]KAF1807819.1 putative short chain type dehydrogenase [Eremomyces bilateralis CBS 781.70]
MAAKSPIVLIFGAGANVGMSVARTFASKGYKVALAARSLKEADSTDEQLNIPSDLSNTDSVLNAFDKVKQVFGIPSVVVYNASAASFTPADDPLSLSLADLNHVTNINIFSAFVAAQQAVLGFAQLPASAARTFIYTGNITNVATIPKLMSQGIGKSGAAHMIWAAAEAYKDRGYKFYYTDERKADGAARYQISGDTHAELYWDLAHDKTQGPWMQTFVQGVGYKKFDSAYTPLP